MSCRCRIVFMLMSVFLANLEMLFTTMKSNLCFSASASILWKSGLSSVVPVWSGSA